MFILLCIVDHCTIIEFIMVTLSNKTYRKGFTLVELLIVIAILVTISIVAYRGIQERARATEVTSGLTQAKMKLELYKVDNGAYPTTGNLATADIKDGDVSYQYTSDGSAYCLTGTVGATSYKASNTGNPEQGGCAGHGQGGVAAVTNLSTNPSAEGGSPSGYSGVNGSTVALSSAKAKDGSSSILVTLPAAAGSYVGINTTSGYSVSTQFKANTTYMFSVSVYVPTGTVNVNLSAQGAGVASSSCNSSSTSTSVKDAWVRLSCPFTTSASGTLALYILNSTASTAGMQFYSDSVMFTEGSTLYNYADGSSPNWIWNGTPNNSTSTGPAM